MRLLLQGAADRITTIKHQSSCTDRIITAECQFSCAGGITTTEVLPVNYNLLKREGV